jgi:hypothetical protein
MEWLSVKPFNNIKYKDIGSNHWRNTWNFDQNYNLKFDVPAKYLGSEANALIANYLLLKLLSLKKIRLMQSLREILLTKINTDIKQQLQI